MARVLVTGGTGFIGRVLVSTLIDRGDEVTVFSRSKPRAAVDWIAGDITGLAEVNQCLAVRDLDVIYHLASLPGDTGDPRQMVEVNLLGLTNMLKLARDANARRFVLSSSILAYEWYPATKFRRAPQNAGRRDASVPSSGYVFNNQADAGVAYEYLFSQYQLATTILRVTAVVGPDGSGGGRMWHDFAGQLQQGKKVQVPFMSPDELSHFVDVRDVAEMHIEAGNNPAAEGETFNCCSERATRGHEFAQYVREVSPEATIEFGYPWSMAQGGEIEFDMSKVKLLLGFVPRYSMRDAVRNIFEWTQTESVVLASQSAS